MALLFPALIAASSYAEDAALSELEMLSPDNLRKIINKLDKNRNNLVDMDETLTFLHALHESSAGKSMPQVMEQKDLDKDGRLSFQEFGTDVSHYHAASSDKEKEKVVALEKARFKAADEDKDGYLSLKELKNLYYPDKDHGALTLMAEATIEQKDQDGDGFLTASEFYFVPAAPSVNKENEVPMSQMMDFRRLDKDHDGKLSLQELKRWGSAKFHTELKMHKLFELADKDGDGELSAEELSSASKLEEDSTDGQVAYSLVRWFHDSVNSEL